MKSIENFVDALHAGARTIFVLGIVLVILGILSVLAPWVSGLVAQAVVGFVLIGAGITWTVFSFHAKSWGSGLWEALVGVLTVISGVIMLAHPLVNLAILTLVLAAYFTAAGVLKIVFAFQHKPMRGWGWLLFNGIVSILLGVPDNIPVAFLRCLGDWNIGGSRSLDRRVRPHSNRFRFRAHSSGEMSPLILEI